MGSIVNRIKKIREEKGLSISELARLLGQNRQRVQDIELENQKVPQDFLVKFIEHFNIDANWLLTGEGEMYRNIPKDGLDPEIQAVVTIMKDLEPEQKTTIRASAENAKQFTQMKRQLSELTTRLSA